MALMVLLRLPTETEMDAAGVEPHTFLDAFNKHSVSPFIAKIKKSGDYIDLDGWKLKKADWFQVVDG